MKQIFLSFRDSARELKNLGTVCVAGLLTAMNVVLGFFRLVFTQFIEIRFSFIPIALCAYLYGPLVSGFAAVIGDVLRYIVRPTGPFTIGFTIGEFIAGVIMGLFYYKKKITLPRVIACQAVVTILIHCLFNTWMLSTLYGQPFEAIIGLRVVKSLIMLPIETLIVFTVFKSAEKALFRLRKPA